MSEVNKNLKIDLNVNLYSDKSLGVTINKESSENLEHNNYVEQAECCKKKFEEYDKLDKIIQINFDTGNNASQGIKFTDRDDENIVSREKEFIRVNVPCFLNKCISEEEDNLTELDRLIGLIGARDRKYADKIIRDNEMLRKIYDIVEEFNEDEEIRKSYEEECLCEEIITKIVKKLLKDSIDISLISKLTGLSLSRINSMKEKI